MKSLKKLSNKMIKYKKLNIQRINQIQNEATEKGVYFGLWNFGDIINSLRFTYRVPKLLFDEGNFNPPKSTRNENDYFQRLVSDERTSRIIDFLINEIIKHSSYITFPSTFILSLPLSELEKEEYLKLLNESDKKDLYSEPFGVYLDDNQVLLPEIDIMLVVDGQHRLAGLKSLMYAIQEILGEEIPDDSIEMQKAINYAKKRLDNIKLDDPERLKEIKNMINNFQLCCTILIDFDIYEQGKVFADVNFNQKPVNRSLYYDIYGSFPNVDNKNDIYLLHKWCVNLNSNNNSELKNKFKLLGNGKGYVSQAFFCDSLLPYLRKNGIWFEIANDFTLDRIDDSDKIQDFLEAYFNAIAKKFGAGNNEVTYFWPREDDIASKFNSILLKTTGLGALIKLIPHFYLQINNNSNFKKEEIEVQIYDTLKSKLSKENLEKMYPNSPKDIEHRQTGAYYFSKDTTIGAFSGGAGKGLQDKLYKELLRDLGFDKT